MPPLAPQGHFDCGCRYDQVRFTFCAPHAVRIHTPRIRKRMLTLFGSWDPSMWPALIAWKIQTLRLQSTA